MTIPSSPDFATLLRQFRRAAGLTQSELAELATLSARAVSDLERGERQIPRRITVDLLAAALHLSREEHTLLTSSVLRRRSRQVVERPSTAADSDSVLPVPPARLIGREQELAMVRRMLGEQRARLLTVSGPGGVGKTRLALEVARALADTYADGVRFIPLADVHGPELVPDVIVRAIGGEDNVEVSPVDSLVKSLRHRQILLVLDNVEHLRGSGPMLAEVLSRCAGVTIVVTSRAVLHIRGEHNLTLQPLMLAPVEEYVDVETVLASPAVALFVERGNAALAPEALKEEHARAIAEICRKLDGLPLAIELAAARVRLLPPPILLERLAVSWSAIGPAPQDMPERHRTLAATIAWSYNLLHAGEQALFRRLAVFAGGASLAAIEAVCRTGEGDLEADVLDWLGSLLDNSLLWHIDVGDDEPRLGMLQTIQAYALECLEAEGESDRARERHAGYFARLVEQAEPEFRGPTEGPWLQRLDLEQENVRAALRWHGSAPGDPQTGLQMAWRLYWFWYQRGHLREGRTWLSLMLAAAPDAPESDRANALRASGVLASAEGAYEEAVQLLEQSLALNRTLDRPREIALCLNSMGIIACEQGQPDHAITLLEEGLTIRRELGNTLDIAASLLNMGFAVHSQGDWERSQLLHEEALALGRSINGTALVALSLHNLGQIAVLRRDYDRAIPLLHEALVMIREGGETRRIASTLEALAGAELDVGDPLKAARLAGAATTMREAWGAPIQPNELPEWERTLVNLRAAVDAGALSHAWTEGQAFTVDEAIAHALARE